MAPVFRTRHGQSGKPPVPRRKMRYYGGIHAGGIAAALPGQNAAERSRQNMAMMDEITARFCFYIRYY